MAKAKKDRFVNRITQGITMSGADELTYTPISMGVGLFQGVALVIHRVLYTLAHVDVNRIIAATDSIQCAITTSDQPTDINVDQTAVIDRIEWRVYISGTPAVSDIKIAPDVHDFSALPGGGLIVPANPLFLAMESVSIAAAAHADVVIYFTFLELTDADYIELMQATVRANV